MTRYGAAFMKITNKKYGTSGWTSFIFILGTSIFSLMSTSCTNLADVVEGNNSGNVSEESQQHSENNNEPHPTQAVDLEAILTSLGENVILPVYEDFQTAAVALKVASDDYASAVETNSDDATEKLTTLREAWQTAMSTWQHAEMLQVGPAGNSSKVTAGANIRDEIYSWPTVNSCRVDQELVEDVYSDSSFFSDELVNVYGLDAIEYLIFEESTENTCPSVVHLNTSGAWSALGDEAIKAGRAQYSKALAENLVTRANELVSYWSAEDGNFIDDLAKAGKSGSVYETQLDALNDVFAAMFFIDTTIKDKKLAIPAGLDATCETACPEKAESQWAHVSKENIVANLKAFQRTFHGGLNAENSVGFDDFLVELGYEELAKTMTDDIVNAISVVEAVDGTLKDAISNDTTSVRDAYDAVKKITDHLKGDFVTILGLTIPAEGAGDAD